MKSIKFLITAFFVLGLSVVAISQNTPTAKEIIKISDEKVRGLNSYAELSMKIIRPDWSREMQMKSWSKGDELALIVITAPARDRGMGFLKRGNEMWNWQPSIDRTIKLPPSMMLQSWMGSDFTNDDLVKQSSLVVDYTHKLLGKETVEGRECYKIQLIPLEDAPVVWGKVIMWIDVKEYMQLKVEFYDEDDYLVNTMLGKNIKMLGGKLLPAVLEVIPEDEDGNKTVIEYLTLDFKQTKKDDFYSIQNLKRVRY
ncbi:MAG: outer membrane lipoprotein-sorting protein [Bacteroidetes bacterium]|nr:MAG: outer membrane lipoprotein-sorting protein [Bacteroidota bacterium]